MIKDFLENIFGEKGAIFIIIFFNIIIIYLIFAFIFSVFPFKLVSQITNTDSIINNYEWFYNQYHNISAQTENIKIISKSAVERTGMIMVLNSSIAEYNSRSKQITRNLWNPNDLPYSINFYME